jgi:hypothetical protein
MLAERARDELRQSIEIARGDDETLEDIGPAAGLSRQRISQVLKGG